MFTVTVKNGGICAINKNYNFVDTAIEFGRIALDGKEFPNWKDAAIKALMQVFGKDNCYGGIGDWVDSTVPATAPKVIETLAYVQATYEAFRLKFEIPQVLENGEYSISDFPVKRR